MEQHERVKASSAWSYSEPPRMPRPEQPSYLQRLTVRQSVLLTQKSTGREGNPYFRVPHDGKAEDT